MPSQPTRYRLRVKSCVILLLICPSISVAHKLLIMNGYSRHRFNTSDPYTNEFRRAPEIQSMDSAPIMSDVVSSTTGEPMESFRPSRPVAIVRPNLAYRAAPGNYSAPPQTNQISNPVIHLSSPYSINSERINRAS